MEVPGVNSDRRLSTAGSTMSSDAFFQCFVMSSSQPDDGKPQWPADLLNLDGDELAKLSDMGGQNPYSFERNHSISALNTQDMGDSRSQSSPLLNESLESLIQDLQELSQPETEEENFVLRTNEVKNLQVSNVCPLVLSECLDNEKLSDCAYANDPLDDGIIFSTEDMCCEDQAVFVKNRNICVEEGSNTMEESSIDSQNVTYTARYVCKGIRALPLHQPAMSDKCSETDSEIRTIVENIVLVASSNDADSVPNMLLNNLGKEVGGLSAAELKENMAEDQMMRQQNSEQSVPEITFLQCDEKMPSPAVVELEETMCEEYLIPESNPAVDSPKLLIIPQMRSSTFFDSEGLKSGQQTSSHSNFIVKTPILILFNAEEKVAGSPVTEIEGNIGEEQSLPQHSSEVECNKLPEVKMPSFTVVEPEEKFCDGKILNASSSKGICNTSNATECLNSVPEIFECDTCHSEFAKFTNLSRHIGQHTSSNIVFCCDPCDMTFESDKDLVSHNIKLHNYPTEFMCDVCSIKLPTLPEFEEHMGSHFNTQPFSCGECHSKFKMFSDFCRHSRQHTGEVLHECLTCPSVFRSESDLRIHELMIHSEMSHVNCDNSMVLGEKEVQILEHNSKCEICGKYFKNSRGLLMHSIAAHRIREKKKKPTYECSECGSGFHTAAVYSRHVSTHQLKARKCHLKAKLKIKLSSLTCQEAKFVCSVCSKIYKRETHFKRHMVSEHSHESKQWLLSENGKKSASKTVPMNTDRKSRSQSLLLHNGKGKKSVKYEDKVPKHTFSDTNNNTNKIDWVESMDCLTGMTFGKETSNHNSHPGSEPTADSLLRTGSTHYHCAHCSVSFESLSDLVQHKQLHPLALLCLKCINAFSLDTTFDLESCQHLN